jgi:hypothetical protein
MKLCIEAARPVMIAGLLMCRKMSDTGAQG